MNSFFGDFYAGLRSAIADRGNTSLEWLKNSAVEADESELLLPCYIAMCCFGSAGLEAIVHAAAIGPKVKHKTNAILVLASIATNGIVSRSPFVEADFTSFANGIIEKQNLNSTADQAFKNFLLSTETEDIVNPLSQVLMNLSFGGSGITEKVISYMAMKWVAFGPATIDQIQVVDYYECKGRTVVSIFLPPLSAIFGPNGDKGLVST